MNVPLSIAASVGSLLRNVFGRGKQIGEEEFKRYRRESLDPVIRSGVCYVPMPGFESTIHYRDKQNLHHLGRYEWAVRVLKDLPRTSRVLDSACGVGYGSLKLASIFDRVDAVDRFDLAIAMGKARYNDPKIHWHCLDVEKLSGEFDRESFDAIVSMQTIESVDDDDKYLDDLHDLLAPRGVLLIDTPIRKMRVDLPENPHHRRYYGIDEWLEKLQSRFAVRVFADLPEANFLERCEMPSQGSIVHCTKVS